MSLQGHIIYPPQVTTDPKRPGKKRLNAVRSGPRLSNIESLPATAAAFSRMLQAEANPAQARLLQSFFKTGPGQYGEGDIFLGIKVPVLRRCARRFRQMPPAEAAKLVCSKFHEERLGGLLLWVQAFERGDARVRARILDLYLKHRNHINNWDLVDLSAPTIVGRSLDTAQFALLNKLAGSKSVWDRRIAVLATFACIRQGNFEPTLDLCAKLITDQHDLMHKACGWMLREVGKRDRLVLSRFLEQHAATMPRTMLRYSLEHYPQAERVRFMQPGTRSKRPIRARQS